MTYQAELWFYGSSFKGFSIVFLLPDWLKLNHLKSRMECGFSDIFARHTTQQVLARKNVQKSAFEAAEMMLGPWNQQYNLFHIGMLLYHFSRCLLGLILHE